MTDCGEKDQTLGKILNKVESSSNNVYKIFILMVK